MFRPVIGRADRFLGADWLAPAAVLACRIRAAQRRDRVSSWRRQLGSSDHGNAGDRAVIQVSGADVNRPYESSMRMTNF
ncbi:uncharacterized protein CIMG_12648 [Coccidioides immitis RS]|uniref:Uncharacterized protein n=1 Tax=Coccidioides immitis (strain RS) TaxID=246410 RepID=A0A0D8JUN1_COCIM|nr:uncharacterized protein CIMG_12648 [Coccidioides immitis RS]KJF59978.1 hypothetical protein CIMG_12648 [Coccidioides immitis RS]